MTTRKIPSWVLPTTIIVLLVSGIFLLGRYGAAVDKEVIESGAETTAIVCDVDGQRMIKVRYTVDGKEYVAGDGKPFSVIFNGEMFYMKYDQSDATSFFVFYDKPFFSPEYSYNETECVSVEKTMSILSFKYNVNGRVYEREALYTNNQPSNLQECIVRYRADDPKIGYLIMK
jgi:hypothetical protein